MKRVIAAVAMIAICGPLGLAFAAERALNPSKSPSVTINETLREIYLTQQEVDRATALIKSRVDLDKHYGFVQLTPLNKLPSFARSNFLQSLVFTETGLSSLILMRPYVII